LYRYTEAAPLAAATVASSVEHEAPRGILSRRSRLGGEFDAAEMAATAAATAAAMAATTTTTGARLALHGAGTAMPLLT
jgi:hypothetical protein